MTSYFVITTASSSLGNSFEIKSSPLSKLVQLLQLKAEKPPINLYNSTSFCAYMVVTREVIILKRLFYMLLLATLLLSACGKNTAPKEAAVDSNTSIEDIVRATVKSKFTVEDTKGVVTISIQDADVKQGSKSQMLKDSAKIFAELSKLKSVKTPIISWSAPLTEPGGTENMTEVLNIYFNEKDFRKVNWANYSQLNLESIASHYHQNEALGQ